MRSKFRLTRLVQWAEKWRWLILASIGLSLLWVEVQEFLVLRVLNQAFHYFEVFQYAVLLISTGTLIELYSRSNKAYKDALKILEYKHSLSLEFAANEDWDFLTAGLAELPGRIVEVDETYLLVGNPINEKLEVASHWENMKHASNREPWDPTIPCPACLEKVSGKKINFHLCRNDSLATTFLTYSLGIVGQNTNMAVLKFKLIQRRQLSSQEQELFVNIGDEIAAALRASRNRRRVLELQSAQVAMAERRMVSAYIHDQLGQNLGYLHLKLDQLGNNKSIRKSKGLQIELNQLQSVANDSYEKVRDILEKIQPETVSHLTNILKEHARKISQRAEFSLHFKSTGNPVRLSPEAQQMVFSIFYETLNNIEKHARADKVDVIVVWQDSCLDISVSDNGIGFDSQTNGDENHFGLTILHERITKLNGNLTIDSSIDSGTLISISIPLNQIEEAIR